MLVKKAPNRIKNHTGNLIRLIVWCKRALMAIKNVNNAFIFKRNRKRDYHIYRGTSWNNTAVHQSVEVMKQINEKPVNIDVCCLKVTISRLDKIYLVTVVYIPREEYVFYFLQEWGSVTGSILDIHQYQRETYNCSSHKGISK